MSLRILITGGAGFVALHTAEQAVARGHQVCLLDIRNPVSELAGMASGARFQRADILAPLPDDVAHATFDVILHLAAIVGPIASRQDPGRATEVNVMGTSRMLERARNSGARLIYLSTATLYGRRPELLPLDETAPADPVSIYDATKFMGETLCASYRRTFGVEAAAIRTGFVFGRGNSVGQYFVPAVLQGEPVNEPIGGDHPCDFTYVVDIARALVLAAEARTLPEPVYNVTGGRLATRQTFADAVTRVLPQARLGLGAGIDPDRHLRGACLLERASRDFGYVPTATLEEAIADWVERAS